MKEQESLSLIHNKFLDKFGVRSLSAKYESKKIQTIEFENMTHFIDVTDAMYKDKEYIYLGMSGGAENIMKYENKDYEKDWRYGSYNDYKTCREHLVEGKIHESMLSMIESYRSELDNNENIKQLAQQAKSTKRRRVFSEDGSELNIDILMSGDPNYWESMTKGRKQNSVRIDIDCCVSSGTSEKKFAEITAIAFVATENLLLAGYAVEVYATFCFKHLTDKVMWGNISIPLKVGDNEIDMQLIAQLGNIGLFRNFIFRTTPLFEGTVEYGIGQVYEPPEAVKNLLGFGNYISCKWDQKECLLRFDDMFKSLVENKEVEYV